MDTTNTKLHILPGNLFVFINKEEKTCILHICNDQKGYYDKQDNSQPIDYDALRACIKKYKNVKFLKDTKTILPKIGNSNAKGDWDKISQIPTDKLKD